MVIFLISFSASRVIGQRECLNAFQVFIKTRLQTLKYLVNLIRIRIDNLELIWIRITISILSGIGLITILEAILRQTCPK